MSSGTTSETGGAVIGAFGQYGLIAFQASSTQASFNLECSNAIRINAIQIRDVTGYWLGNASGVWSDSAANFMGGMAFDNAQIVTGGFVAFTDLGAFRGIESHSNVTRTVALNRDISIQSAGVAIGTVRFENNSDTYTFSNASENTGITGTSQVVMNGTGRVVLNGANTYSGGTVVNAGTLVVNNTTGSATGTGTVTIASGARLEGSGTISGHTTVNGTHAPGNSPGIKTFEDGVSYGATSVFAWELIGDTTDGRGTSWDAVNLTGGTMTVDAGATFQIIVNSTGSDVNFTNAFWNQIQTWEVFSTSGAATIASTFQNLSVTFSGGNNYSADLGTFSMSSGTLTWTPIPEPSSALAGLLLAAGLMHRRRSQRRSFSATA